MPYEYILPHITLPIIMIVMRSHMNDGREIFHSSHQHEQISPVVICLKTVMKRGNWLFACFPLSIFFFCFHRLPKSRVQACKNKRNSSALFFSKNVNGNSFKIEYYFFIDLLDLWREISIIFCNLVFSVISY